MPCPNADEIAEAVAEYDDGDLAKYADARNGDSYYKKLKRIHVSVEIYNHELYGVANCTVADDWNETDGTVEKLFDRTVGRWVWRGTGAARCGCLHRVGILRRVR